MIPPAELVLFSTEIYKITSKAVLSAGYTEGGEGGSNVLEAAGVFLFLLSFGYMGIKWAIGAYNNKED